MMFSKTSSDVDERYFLYGLQMWERNFCSRSSPSPILHVCVKYRKASVPISGRFSDAVLQDQNNVAIVASKIAPQTHTSMKTAIKQVTEKSLSTFA